MRSKRSGRGMLPAIPMHFSGLRLQSKAGMASKINNASKAPQIAPMARKLPLANLDATGISPHNINPAKAAGTKKIRLCVIRLTIIISSAYL
jgi:hypothetical protein